jgi:hypothetical protein
MRKFEIALRSQRSAQGGQKGPQVRGVVSGEGLPCRIFRGVKKRLRLLGIALIKEVPGHVVDRVQRVGMVVAEDAAPPLQCFTAVTESFLGLARLLEQHSHRADRAERPGVVVAEHTAMTLQRLAAVGYSRLAMRAQGRRGTR